MTQVSESRIQPRPYRSSRIQPRSYQGMQVDVQKFLGELSSSISILADEILEEWLTGGRNHLKSIPDRDRPAIRAAAPRHGVELPEDFLICQ